MSSEFDVRRLRSTARYQRARKEFHEENPLCAMCLADGRFTPSKELDHIVPVEKAPERFWNRTNWQMLCVSCHLIKTANENQNEETPDERAWRERIERVYGAAGPSAAHQPPPK